MSHPVTPRLGDGFGLFIDRNKPVSFRFDGKTFTGLDGDVITSALAGVGTTMISRSFKYHRPRGLLSLAGHDANSIVKVGKEPNVFADLTPISEGLDVHSVNTAGSLNNDRMAILDLFGRFLPVGFYYRSFFKPGKAWKFWEPLIRRMAGLGVIDPDTPHGYFDKAYGFYDVVVVGGGHSGMNAAIEAARDGASVLIIEEAPLLGGALNYMRLDADGTQGMAICRELLSEIESSANIEIMTNTTATGLFTDGWVAAVRGNRLYKIRAGAVVVAAGAVEQPAVFRNNDRPGIMLASAASRLMRLYGVTPGSNGIILTANDDGYGLALDCLDAGVAVTAILDLRTSPPDTPMRLKAKSAHITIHDAAGIAKALGKCRVNGVVISNIDEDGAWTTVGKTLPCDFVAMAVGYTPNGALIWQGGGWFNYDSDAAYHMVSSLPTGVHAAGMVNGVFEPGLCAADGRRAGASAGAGNPSTVERLDDSSLGRVNHPYPVFSHPKAKDFVDFDEDLQTKDLINGLSQGYRDVQLLKRFSTLGMGPSQGRHSNVNAIRLIARIEGKAEDEVGATTTRPPYRTEKMGVLAGRSFEPIRRTAMHHRHIEAGAQMMPAGAWMRPAYYGPKENAKALIAEEVMGCRGNLGLIDVSTLGGLDVRGPDAAELVNRMYTWAYANQDVGRGRYLLMTEEAGVVIDDGVACRFADDHFYLTATTSGVDGVYRQMLLWNAQWRLNVDITNVTGAYAGVNIAGPNARKALAKVCDDVDISADGFPYMGVRQGTVAGIPARLLRVGFVGELGYEIHVPAHHGEALWDALMQAGAEFSIRPFGVEAQRVMRLEKGHIIIGQDTDGLTTPFEADMGWAVAKKKPFYIGKRSVDIQNASPAHRRLIGFRLTDKSAPCPEECHLVMDGETITGRVTSAVRSPSLDEVVGLAYVPVAIAEAGGTFTIKLGDGQRVEAQVSPIPFYDPDNKRQEL